MNIPRPDYPQLSSALATVVKRGELLREGRLLLSSSDDEGTKDYIRRVDEECGPATPPVDNAHVAEGCEQFG